MLIADFNKNDIVSAVVMNTSACETIDLGIAKLHFEIGSGVGTWQLGNN